VPSELKLALALSRPAGVLRGSGDFGEAAFEEAPFARIIRSHQG
jgi:hypothetical protein